MGNGKTLTLKSEKENNAKERRISLSARNRGRGKVGDELL